MPCDIVRFGILIFGGIAGKPGKPINKGSLADLRKVYGSCFWEIFGNLIIFGNFLGNFWEKEVDENEEEKL